MTDSYEYREKTLLSRLLYNATEICQQPIAQTIQPRGNIYVSHVTPSSAANTNKTANPMSAHMHIPSTGHHIPTPSNKNNPQSAHS
jgi:hypothetical protein